MVLARGWGEGKMESYYLNEYRISVWEDESVLESDGGDGGPTM